MHSSLSDKFLDYMEPSSSTLISTEDTVLYMKVDMENLAGSHIQVLGIHEYSSSKQEEVWVEGFWGASLPFPS